MRHMSPVVVDKITSEVLRSPRLRTVKHFECGENGDAFLNPAAMDCLRIIKQRLPECTVGVYTNFQTLTPDLAEELLRHKLIDSFNCNIDGHDEEHYRSVKGTGLRQAEDNLLGFLKVRGQLGVKVPLRIMSVNYNDYVELLWKHFGILPSKAAGHVRQGLKRDFDLIWRKWKPLLDPQTDKMIRLLDFSFWAERAELAERVIQYEAYACPVLDRVKHEAFIAPDGTWYACCVDAECELVMGNVMANSIETLMDSDRRSNLIAMLQNREFAQIGGPCKTVQCCQCTILDRPIDRLSRFVGTSPFGNVLRNLCAKSRFLRDSVDRIRGRIP